MEFYAYAFIELIILLALPLYIFGVIVCALAGAEHETGWLTALFLAIFFTPIVGLICVFSSPLKSEVWRQKKQLEQNEEIIKLLQQLQNIKESNI